MGRRRASTDASLLAAALKLFSEHGIDAVSIRSVNREAGLGPASVHYHFGTKDALFDAVIHVYGESVIATTKARAQEILATDGPTTARDLVTMLAEPYLDLMATHDQGRACVVSVISSLCRATRTHPRRPSARMTWAAAPGLPRAAPRWCNVRCGCASRCW